MKKRTHPNAGSWIAVVLIAALLIAFSAGLSTPKGSAAASAGGIRFLRVMSSNRDTCLPVGGEYRDWVELINTSERAQELSGWSITRGIDVRGEFQFPHYTLNPGETVVLYGGNAVNGAPSDALFLGFPISSDGDQLTLSANTHQVMDAVEIPPIPSGSVYALNVDSGAWSVMKPADDYGWGVKLDYGTTPRFTPSGVYISEIMPVNSTTLMDSRGEYSDWIELYNGGDTAVALDGWSLTDNVFRRRKFVFPHISIEPHAYLLVFASGTENLSGELHAAFRLSSKGERVLLFNAKGEAVSYMDYDRIESDWSVARSDIGTVSVLDAPSPGFANDSDGTIRALDPKWTMPVANAYGLYINEVMTSMEGGPDWVEIVNESGADIDLSGFGLSDNPSKPRKWQFPAGTTVAAQNAVMIALIGSDGSKTGAPKGSITANFALSVDQTERLTLSDPTGASIDQILLIDQRRGVSYGRVPGTAEYGYFEEPTPGKPNTTSAFRRAAREISFSHEGGLQSGAIQLEMRTSEGVNIYYTLDGSVPTTASNLYVSPIPIMQNTVVRAMAVGSGVLPSSVATRTFLFDTPRGMKVICVAGDPEELTGEYGTLITSKPGNGYDVHAEIYDQNGITQVSQDCFFKLNGSGSIKMFDQKAFRLVAKKQYGDNRFHADLFDSLDYDTYKAVVIRCGGQDNHLALLRDVLLSSLAKDTLVLYQESQPVSVYINGQYWGFYFMRERVCEQMICQHEGWDEPKDLDILKGTGLSVFQGSKDYWTEMMDYVKRNGVKTDANLQTLRTYMDVENYLEYVMLEMYTDNQDLGNVCVYRNRGGDGLWRWVFFDLDLGFRANVDPVSGWASSSGKVGTITTQTNVLFRALMQNEYCREYFLSRFGEMLTTNLSSEYVRTRLREVYASMQEEMKYSTQRWDVDYADWQGYVNAVDKYAEKETSRVINSLIKQFSLSDADAQRYFGAAMAQEGMQ